MDHGGGGGLQAKQLLQLQELQRENASLQARLEEARAAAAAGAQLQQHQQHQHQQQQALQQLVTHSQGDEASSNASPALLTGKPAGDQHLPPPASELQYAGGRCPLTLPNSQASYTHAGAFEGGAPVAALVQLPQAAPAASVGSVGEHPVRESTLLINGA